MSISNQPFADSRVRLSYNDYALFPDNGNRHEIIDGRHYMNPAPSSYHQSISMRMCYQLFSMIDERNLGRVFSAPIDVQLGEYDIVQPDIVVVLAGNSIIESRIQGTPDLVVEILSSSTKVHDEQLKKHLYEQNGVPEYWIVDPTDKVVHQFSMTNGRFADAVVSAHQIQFGGLDDIVVDLTRVW